MILQQIVSILALSQASMHMLTVRPLACRGAQERRDPGPQPQVIPHKRAVFMILSFSICHSVDQDTRERRYPPLCAGTAAAHDAVAYPFNRR